MPSRSTRTYAPPHRSTHRRRKSTRQRVLRSLLTRAERAAEPNPAALRLRRRRVLLGLYSLIAIEACAALLTSPVFAVRQIVVSGTENLPRNEAAQVIEAAHLPERTNWFLIPTGTVGRRLSAQPWLRSEETSLVRRLPNLYRVSIAARQPVAVLETGRPNDPACEIDAFGIPIRAARAAAVLLPRIKISSLLLPRLGTQIVNHGLQSALEILATPLTAPCPAVVKIEVDQNSNLCLNMKDGIAVRLGVREDVSASLTQIQTIYAAEPRLAWRMASIDLSCSTAPVCTNRELQGPPTADSIRVTQSRGNTF